MFKHILIPLLMVVFSFNANAQDSGIFEFADDYFAGGSDVAVNQDKRGDVFLAGYSVRLDARTGGSAHVAGRRITVDAPVEGNLYAFGMDVSVAAPIAGNATLAGYEIRMQSTIGGNLRATAATLRIIGNVDGSAILAGEDVTISGVVTGDLVLTGENIDFGADAKIIGSLKLYAEDPDSIEIPSSVISPDRVLREKVEEWEYDAGREIGRKGFMSILSGLLWTMFTTAIVAVLFAAVAPKQLAVLRRQILAQPFRSVWFGLLGHSLLIGGAIILALTIIAIFVSPALLLAAGVVAMLGYVVGAYALGVGLLTFFGKPEPEILVDRALAAFVGAIVAGIIALIPFFGWLFALTLIMLGSGSLVVWIFRPQFFVSQAANSTITD